MIGGIDRDSTPSSVKRTVDLETWSSSDIPLLRDPQAFVADLYELHMPLPGTATVAVLDPLHRLLGSASFTPRSSNSDGWQHRNQILTHLRATVPHDLRRATPSRTAVLMLCRQGEPGWTAEDGAWMWAIRDAAALHGLRCGAYITLTPQGWQILGDNRSSRNPHAGSAGRGTPSAVTALRDHSAGRDRTWVRGPVEPLRRTAAR